MGIAFAVLLFTGAVISAEAKDCMISKEFQLREAQALSGTFEDPAGWTVPGLEVELLSNGEVLRGVHAGKDGRYDLGEVPAGKYRIRIRRYPFCAPKVRCGKNGCTIGKRLEIPRSSLTVTY
jgi:hypothetical protein